MKPSIITHNSIIKSNDINNASYHTPLKYKITKV